MELINQFWAWLVSDLWKLVVVVVLWEATKGWIVRRVAPTMLEAILNKLGLGTTPDIRFGERQGDIELNIPVFNQSWQWWKLFFHIPRMAEECDVFIEVSQPKQTYQGVWGTPEGSKPRTNLRPGYSATPVPILLHFSSGVHIVDIQSRYFKGALNPPLPPGEYQIVLTVKEGEKREWKSNSHTLTVPTTPQEGYRFDDFVFGSGGFPH